MKTSSLKPAAPRRRARSTASAGADPAAAPADRVAQIVVGIGASAGGLEALTTLLTHLPILPAVSYVVVQHLSPTHRSMLTQLLHRATEIPVVTIEDQAVIEPGYIYVAPPKANLNVEAGRLQLVPPEGSGPGPRPSINAFFVSLAEQYGEAAVGIILSGTGSDGAAGLHTIKAHGGFTLVQEPNSAAYTGMPQAALGTGAADWVLPPEQMGEVLRQIVRLPAGSELAPPEPKGMRKLLLMVKRRTQVDLSGYKDTTLRRRLERRIKRVGVAGLDEYLDYIGRHPEELDAYFQDILISVTGFFRDPGAFAALESALQQLVAGKEEGEEIRIWVAGCATGEEPVSIALLLARLLGSRLGRYKIQIFATDIDVAALAQARRGLYALAALQGVSKADLAAHFTPKGDLYELRKELRDLLIFARHDLTRDPPFLRLDLVSCRNVLIYFKSDLQARVLAAIHFGLRPGGLLFLGHSENTPPRQELFKIVDTRAKLYVRLDSTAKTAKLEAPRVGAARSRRPASKRELEQNIFAEAAMRLFLPPCVVVDERYHILHVHGEAGQYLRLAAGKPQFDLISLIHPHLRAEAQALLLRVRKKAASAVGRAHLPADDASEKGLRLSAYRLEHNHQALYLVVFEPVAPARRGRTPSLSKDLQRELEATREHLQTVVEELQTSNEELQALNEEVQAANEELQAANEELESSNEELQSTNEELITVNKELHANSQELRDLSEDLQQILQAVHFPMLVVDRQGQVLRHNAAAAAFFRPEQVWVGRPVREVLQPPTLADLPARIDQVLASYQGVSEPVTVEGRHYLLDITPYQDAQQAARGAVVSLVDHTSLMAQRQQLLAVMNTSLLWVALKDLAGRYTFVNAPFAQAFGLTPAEIIGRTDQDFLPEPLARGFAERERMTQRLGRAVEAEEHWPLPAGGRTLLTVRFPLLDEAGLVVSLGLQVLDITERQQAEDEARRLAQEIRVVVNTATIGLGHIRDGRVQWANLAFEQLFGLAPGASQGRSLAEFYVSEAAYQRAGAAVEAAWAHGGTHTAEVELRRADATTFWCAVAGQAVEPANPEAGSIWSFQDITARRQFDLALRESEALFRLLADAAPVMVWLAGPDQRRYQFNKGWLEFTGRRLEQELDHGWTAGVHPDDVQPYLQAYTAAFDARRPFKLEYRLRRQDGEYRWLIDNGVPRFLPEGQFAGYIGACLDLTERKQAEQHLTTLLAEKEVLLKEIHHRVKNNLQVVVSLLGLQAERIADPAALSVFTESQERVQSIALVHEKLYQSPDLARIDFAEYLQELTLNLSQVFPAERAALRLEAAPVRLGVDTAIPCGLIVNELVTNALKYAFADGRAGQVLVSFAEIPAAGALRRFRLSVVDDGVGLPAGLDLAQTHSLGLNLVQILVRQLDGELTLNCQNGAAYTIHFNERREQGHPIAA